MEYDAIDLFSTTNVILCFEITLGLKDIALVMWIQANAMVFL